MIKWAAGGLILDVYDDIYMSTFQEDPSLLEKLGSVTLLPQDSLNKIANDKFGLIVIAGDKKLRKYPIHDADHVKLAQVFFEKNAPKLTPYMQKVAGVNILKAAKLFGVRPSEFLNKFAGETAISNYADATAADHGVSYVAAAATRILPDSAFALVKTAGQKTVRMYPIESAYQVKQGADHFEANHKSLKPLERVKIAAAIVKQAAALKVEVKHPALLKYASSQPNPNFKLYTEMRADMLPDGESKTVLRELIEKRAEYKGQSFGRALEIFDEKTGLNSFWDVTIPDPYHTCFSYDDGVIDAFGMQKKASDEERIMKIAKSDRLGEVFSDASVKQFRENPVAIFNSLPEPTKRLLLNME